ESRRAALHVVARVQEQLSFGPDWSESQSEQWPHPALLPLEMSATSLPFSTAVHSFLADLRTRIARGDADEKTLVAYEVAVRNGAMRHFPRKSLDRITTADVIAMREAVRGNKPADTRNRRP